MNGHNLASSHKVKQWVVLGHYRGKPKPAGQEWETNYVDVLTVEQGIIKRFEAYFDIAAAIRSRKAKLD